MNKPTFGVGCLLVKRVLVDGMFVGASIGYCYNITHSNKIIIGRHQSEKRYHIKFIVGKDPSGHTDTYIYLDELRDTYYKDYSVHYVKKLFKYSALTFKTN